MNAEIEPDESAIGLVDTNRVSVKCLKTGRCKSTRLKRSYTRRAQVNTRPPSQTGNVFAVIGVIGSREIFAR